MALASTSSTYNQLLTYSIVASLGSGICETVAVMAVDDIFFLHERGAILTYYTAALCLAAIAPLPAGYMLPLPHSWRSAYYLYAACGVFIWIVGIFFLAETHFNREEAHRLYGEAAEHIEGFDDKGEPVVTMSERVPLPQKYTFWQMMKPYGYVNKDLNLFTPFWRQFTFIVYPAVIWAVIFYGLAIGLGALYIGFTFSILITEPPYNWAQSQTGLNAISGFVATLLAIPCGPISDRIAAWRTRKNGGVREPEMRLWVVLPTILFSPVGMAVFSCTAYYKLHWFGFFAGFCIFQFANFIGFSMLIAYMVDCYNHNTPELISMFIASKSLLSFGVGYQILTWIFADGYLMLGMLFTGIMFFVCSMSIFFMLFGKRIRQWTGKWKITHIQKL
jgi:MFS family permease